jgi:serine/threonine-protein kinase
MVTNAGSNDPPVSSAMQSITLPARYRLIEEVGQGGMAVVYRAQDLTLQREVAVKILHPHLLAEPESKVRLEREARAVAMLNHDNILQIFDFSGKDSTSSYIVTEFVDGETLKQFLGRRKLPVPELAAVIIIELGNALQHAHALGIIHRDLKPENVMLRKDGALKLMDFGVAQILDLERMTVTGQILGSPAYLAPEALDGRPLDFRSDVFSAGVMLYQLATGTLPFSGKNPHEVLRRVSEGKFADPRTFNRWITDSLARVIQRALARNPEDRYTNIAAMLEDLRTYVSDAGLVHPKEELRRFITEPESYEPVLLPRMVTALVTSGQREQLSKRGARTLELWNRALAFDPENAIVLSELRRLENRERWRRIAVGGSILIIVGITVTGTYKYFSKSIRSSQATHSLSTAPIPTSPAKPSAPPDRPTTVATKVQLHKKTVEGSSTVTHRTTKETRSMASTTGLTVPKGEPALSKPPVSSKQETAHSPQITLSLGFSPARVEVWLDGRYAFDYGPQQNHITIPWDKTHVLEFRNDSCCIRKEVIVGPQTYRPPGDHLFVTLDPKPAQVVIDFDQPNHGESLLVREIGEGNKPWRSKAHVGELILVPFDAGEEMRKNLEIIVFKGDKTVTRILQVTAGENRTFTIPMDE